MKNYILIVVFVGLGIALLVAKEKRLHQVLIASIVVSVVIWYIGQAFGMILEGMSTDFNSGFLLVVKETYTSTFMLDHFST